MISQTDLQKLDISSIEGYFETILDYQEQNKKLTVETMLNELGKTQKKSFALYILNKSIENKNKLELLTALINEL